MRVIHGIEDMNQAKLIAAELISSLVAACTVLHIFELMSDFQGKKVVTRPQCVSSLCVFFVSRKKNPTYHQRQTVVRTKEKRKTKLLWVFSTHAAANFSSL